MIVSHARKFIFIHNPKCAGTSFRTAIDVYDDHGIKFWGIHDDPVMQKKLDHAHLRTWEVATVFPEIMDKFATYRSIIFVRNPYARFLSSLREHFLNFRNDELSRLSGAEKLLRVEDFIENEISMDRVREEVAYVHFSPQSWFIYQGGRRIVEHIIPMRPGTNFTEIATGILELPALPVARLNRSAVLMQRLNRSAMSRGAILRSARVISFIEDFYKQDFELFARLEHLRDVALAPAPRTWRKLWQGTNH